MSSQKGGIEIIILLVVIGLSVAFSGAFVYVPKRPTVDPATISSQTIITQAPGKPQSSLQGETFKVDLISGSGGSTDMQYYIDHWRFQQPTTTTPLPQSVINALKPMVPFAIKGATAYDKTYNQIVTPQLLLWWSYEEAIKGNVTMSVCGPHSQQIPVEAICPTPGNWQLGGLGVQFAATPTYLKNAFQDLYPAGTSPQQIGQNVITTYDHMSTTFPNASIDQVVSDINLSSQTGSNLWPSILSRDPAINAYIESAALTPAGLPWTGWMSCNPDGSGYCKGPLSNELWQILQAWPQLSQ
ncbi:MAG: hypothetical protein ACREGI_01290 [Candidatus Levyibacteriota bacterium]